MISNVLMVAVCAVLVHSAEAQVNPAAGVILNNASNTASGDYSGVGGVGSVSGGVGGLVWGIGSSQLGGGSAFGRNLRADGTDSHVTGQGVTVLRDNGVGSGWQNLSSGMQGTVSGHHRVPVGLSALLAGRGSRWWADNGTRRPEALAGPLSLPRGHP